MIKLSNREGQTVYLAPGAIASIQEAGASSAWHGIHSYVRTFDGKTFELQQTPDQINDAIGAQQKGNTQ
ncbi:hypothetical protein RAS12_00490 [Achromobacter seleniivolatilans]|uniref:Uncharacterized protein n=1 Tax=Achromobacter seleniivolatilans TaxID=3047478 RepID=A0ABY9M1L5_9BURK|nr:hypothetical protein [Achromobacter sp. R39]WMD20881.1 hypothetical protein RAS12_00490 [Achromobacter sp. R39]